MTEQMMDKRWWNRANIGQTLLPHLHTHTHTQTQTQLTVNFKHSGHRYLCGCESWISGYKNPAVIWWCSVGFFHLIFSCEDIKNEPLWLDYLKLKKYLKLKELYGFYGFALIYFWFPLWFRCFMTCVGSWKRTETPSGTTSCLYSKTAGTEYSHSLSYWCWMHKLVIQFKHKCFDNHQLCSVCPQARLHLRSLWACRQQKWRWDLKDGHSPT